MLASLQFSLSYGALWLLVAFQSLILLGLVRTVYQRDRDEGRGDEDAAERFRGQPAPAFSAVDLTGARVDSSDYEGRTRVLLFVGPNCASCAVALEDMSVLDSKTNGNIVVVCRGGRDECAGLVETYGLTLPVVADEDFELSRLFAVASVPIAVLIDDDDHIRSYGRARRTEELQELVAEASAGELEEVG
jgi:peroxiredoxin